MSASLGVPPLAPQAGASELARQEVQTRLAGVGGKNLTEAQKDKKLREACQGFESIFIQKMWQEMRNTLPKSNLLQGREEQFWQGMYDQELAKKMAGAGGVGLADMMYAQLSQRLGSASQSAAASAAPARGFSPEAAPLLAANPQQPAAQETAGQGATRAQARDWTETPVSAAAIYDGAAPVRDAGAVGGAMPQTAAGAGSATDAVAAASNPPEVDQALAVLRAQQALQQSGEAQKNIRVTHAGRGDAGLQRARAARFQAGSKLGPGAVLPSLHPEGAAFAGRTQPQAQQHGAAGGVPPLTAQDLAGAGSFMAPTAGQAANPNVGQALDRAALADSSAGAAPGALERQSALQPVKVRYTTNISDEGKRHKDELVRNLQTTGSDPAGQAGRAATAAAPTAPKTAMQQNAPQPMKVRYTTNIPAKGKRHKDELIRTLQTDAAGPNSRAGAGLAAYHAQQAQQAPAASSGQAAQPGGQAAGPLPMQAAVAADPQPGAERGTSAPGIPPLTAADLGG
ncbi:rod-binding protein [uncultured Desulfovibrio sp.]|uniref:rod-binding protein n=1 Tax=uncultured Desulfovibrio sp. TaxID=167968 RepID=UPI00266CA3B3|nr:rod-binding protein [uncultured Desulfovibrio sp.]